MPRPIPCPKKQQLRPSQRCTSLASLPRSKLSWEICAGWVHDQLWQKPLWKETLRSEMSLWRQPPPAVQSSEARLAFFLNAGNLSRAEESARVDYPGDVGENEC